MTQLETILQNPWIALLIKRLFKNAKEHVTKRIYQVESKIFVIQTNVYLDLV